MTLVAGTSGRHLNGDRLQRRSGGGTHFLEDDERDEADEVTMAVRAVRVCAVPGRRAQRPSCRRSRTKGAEGKTPPGASPALTPLPSIKPSSPSSRSSSSKKMCPSARTPPKTSPPFKRGSPPEPGMTHHGQCELTASPRSRPNARGAGPRPIPPRPARPSSRRWSDAAPDRPCGPSASARGSRSPARRRSASPVPGTPPPDTPPAKTPW